jgi:Ni,Fe-hydrogenase maturation factor
VNIRILGIEAGPMELGAGLSQEVEQALPAATSAIETILQSLLN